ncbi:hypothetical protein CRENBAI_017641 [Crenichthys baileyi]|uniref:PEX5-related protein n=1 Tax=Crenichthys baileyi TaxID=28760 RepID=A0AAV9RQY5_9TELE
MNAFTLQTPTQLLRLTSPLDKWDEVNLDLEDGGGRRRQCENRCTSHHSSSELLWSAEFKTDPLTKNNFDIHSFDDLDFISLTQKLNLQTVSQKNQNHNERLNCHPTSHKIIINQKSWSGMEAEKESFFLAFKSSPTAKVTGHVLGGASGLETTLRHCTSYSDPLRPGKEQQTVSNLSPEQGTVCSSGTDSSVSRLRRRTRSLLVRNESLEDEFVRAKAAVEVKLSEPRWLSHTDPSPPSPHSLACLTLSPPSSASADSGSVLTADVSELHLSLNTHIRENQPPPSCWTYYTVDQVEDLFQNRWHKFCARIFHLQTTMRKVNMFRRIYRLFALNVSPPAGFTWSINIRNCSALRRTTLVHMKNQIQRSPIVVLDECSDHGIIQDVGLIDVTATRRRRRHHLVVYPGTPAALLTGSETSAWAWFQLGSEFSSDDEEGHSPNMFTIGRHTSSLPGPDPGSLTGNGPPVSWFLQSDTEFWDKMQAEWEELARRNWLEESESQQKPIPPSVSPVEKGYYFNTNNPYRDWPNAFAEGQEKAREGDLNAAVLLMEAAILQDPSDAEAWQMLGTTQAENENEQAAIVSLQRCLELRPNNLQALMALAVSFTNSSLLPEACDALRRWIGHNLRYRHLVRDSRSPLQGSPATLRRGPGCSTPASSQLQDVLLLFQEAALLNVDSLDPDLQTGLGVLYNLSSEFDKAVEAFGAALSVRPQDYLLWNRLGATLANGNRSEEAVEAYTRALELQPGFIRSRYNLGISCINLGAHREAVSNFLTALNQQRQSQLCSQQQMSANIWAALRIAISMMDRPELFQAANMGDLDLLMRAFERVHGSSLGAAGTRILRTFPEFSHHLLEGLGSPGKAGVLSTALDLVDLGDPAETRERRGRKSPLRRKAGSRSPRHRTRTEETELIQVQVEHLPASPKTPEIISLDSASLTSPLDKWDEVNLDLEDGGGRRRQCENRCTSHHSSSELLWSAEFKTDPLTKNNFDIHSFDDLDFISLTQDSSVSRLRRRTRSLLVRNESLEDEFVRAKAAVEVKLSEPRWLSHTDPSPPSPHSLACLTLSPPSSASADSGSVLTADVSELHLSLNTHIRENQPPPSCWTYYTVDQVEDLFQNRWHKFCARIFHLQTTMRKVNMFRRIYRLFALNVSPPAGFTWSINIRNCSALRRTTLVHMKNQIQRSPIVVLDECSDHGIIQDVGLIDVTATRRRRRHHLVVYPGTPAALLTGSETSAWAWFQLGSEFSSDDEEGHSPNMFTIGRHTSSLPGPDPGSLTGNGPPVSWFLQSDTEFWDKMQAEWEELARRNWLEESESQQKPIPPSVSPVEKGYYFNTNNPYRDWPNAFAEGQEKAREGDLNAAVLLMEAAILQDPSDAEAWQMLGTTQAENENEQAAIVSLQRCLELRPNNLQALMALAVSFTNSSLLPEACDALRRWIGHNLRYRHLVRDSRSPLQGSPATLRRGPGCSTPASSQLQDVLLLFQEAALLNVDSLDPDLQTGLGVLYNLSSEFDKAVEAFGAALSVRPQDYLLWNRLGATLANGNRSEEAVEAYTRALELQPGFIRSRYNLGISCINLGAHREAVSNFLTALNQQRQSQLCSQQQMSANIWAALRIAISMMDRPELFQAANMGDLDLLMRAFERVHGSSLGAAGTRILRTFPEFSHHLLEGLGSPGKAGGSSKLCVFCVLESNYTESPSGTVLLVPVCHVLVVC